MKQSTKKMVSIIIVACILAGASVLYTYFQAKEEVKQAEKETKKFKEHIEKIKLD